MINSIRVRQLLWSGLVLTGVVCGFGGLLYYEVQSSRRGEVDAKLVLAATAVDATLRGFPPTELRSQQPSSDSDVSLAVKSESTPDSQPLKGTKAPPYPLAPGLPRDRFFAELQLPEGFSDYYFAVWRPDGTLLKSVNLPEPSPTLPEVSPRHKLRTRGSSRELVVLGPARTVVLIGRSWGHVERDLTAFARQLIVTGLIVLGIGLAGGWMISHRILRPIAMITTAASHISEHNLTERIETSKVEIELAELATVLNSTFDRLKEAFDRQAQFTADASHELRTPLAVMRSQTELSLSRPRTPEEYQQALHSCLNSTIRMTDLVERLLALARADAGWHQAHKQVVDLDQLVDDWGSQLRRLAESKSLNMSIVTVPVQVVGDPAALGQVVSNLLTNAIQYNRTGGLVAVRVEAQDAEVCLSVTDTGPGIPLADQPHIFERFYRVDRARARASGGTGLGLAICKSIVEAHRGRIEFESHEQQGTTFLVRLPRSDCTEAV
jgi:two-component system, OmpR family, sensor kinase